ncbi:Protein of unknown function [Paramicrobacterium humi]|uniref:DUF2795 domain-containing protein n=1 Tax=Paramicrobacterium humi TaxID=640635 RepID=A0A1H4Q0C3_9MICO|nr:DUF2795 domain-containing protein [Microbacterium humi]SEC13093.1 Protein of unknown function [Microbacterium humi]
MRNDDVTKTGGTPIDASWLRSLDYPATRDDLVVNARRESPDKLDLFRALPERNYSSTRDVLLELRALTGPVVDDYASA